MAERTADTVVLTERFWSKTQEVAGPLSTPCLHWTGRIDNNGRGRSFGRFWYASKPVAAYVVACAAQEGKSLDDMKGLVAGHKCDNPLCVNPEHMEAITQSQNMLDCVARGRHVSQKRAA